MSYIIENANILKESTLTKSSLLIQENRIAGIQKQYRHYQMMKMNLEEFILTPTCVLFNTDISPNVPFSEFKGMMIDKFIGKGCTTLFTYVDVRQEKELTDKLNAMRTVFMSSPIDYAIAVRIPIRLLTDSFIRKCRKEMIPAIFVKLDDPEELENIPWGWLRNSMFPNNCPLIPSVLLTHPQESRKVLAKWKQIMRQEKIPSFPHEIEENQPLSISELNKVGLYPLKSSLLNGAELSYNLYFKSSEIKNVDEMSLFHYHGDRLTVTVHKGKIVRSGSEVLFKSGYGEHVKVKTLAFFSL